MVRAAEGRGGLEIGGRTRGESRRHGASPEAPAPGSALGFRTRQHAGRRPAGACSYGRLYHRGQGARRACNLPRSPPGAERDLAGAGRDALRGMTRGRGYGPRGLARLLATSSGGIPLRRTCSRCSRERIQRRLPGTSGRVVRNESVPRSPRLRGCTRSTRGGALSWSSQASRLGDTTTREARRRELRPKEQLPEPIRAAARAGGAPLEAKYDRGAARERGRGRQLFSPPPGARPRRSAFVSWWCYRSHPRPRAPPATRTTGGLRAIPREPAASRASARACGDRQQRRARDRARDTASRTPPRQGPPRRALRR